MYLSRTFACFYANPAGVLQAKYQEFYPKAEIVASDFFARFRASPLAAQQLYGQCSVIPDGLGSPIGLVLRHIVS
jgi:hypothetical protein